MSHRCLYLPRVVMSQRPQMVVSKVPTESPDTFFETAMTPAEARRYATDLLIDADRAERFSETAKWLAKQK
ncbi:hypothetical protein [Mesorhizobium sp.]|uniref:hypothetical protein n=1 Tax=Mesorhizobium sp. TaxID=1871066 RepID=UPI000FE3F6FF|nr:hypothetical protein [Mesorhizobium sp.]RWK39225.1 MAG: hypothetical protein EOR40_04225 [Mesorhizobium sp.]